MPPDVNTVPEVAIHTDNGDVDLGQEDSAR